MKRRPVLLASVLIGNVFGAVCARLAWIYAEGTLGAVFGMLFALTLFVDWCLLVQARGLAPHRPDYLTVFCGRLINVEDLCGVCGAAMCFACFEMGCGVCRGPHR